MTPTATTGPRQVRPDRRSKVDRARDAASLPRKPLPVLYILAAGYRDGESLDAKLMLRPGCNRADAMRELWSRLDAAEPVDFGSVVAAWAERFQARWIG